MHGSVYLVYFIFRYFGVLWRTSLKKNRHAARRERRAAATSLEVSHEASPDISSVDASVVQESHHKAFCRVDRKVIMRDAHVLMQSEVEEVI